MSKDLIQRSELAKRYFADHLCVLTPVKEVTKKESLGLFHKLILLNIEDVRGWRLFESFSEYAAEIERHQKNYPCTIHPYSQLRRVIEILFCIYILTFLAIYSIIACMPERIALFNWCVNLEFIYCVNIAFNFFSGYVKGNTHRTVVLNLRKIAYHYLTTWFILDLVSVFLHFPLIFSPSLITNVRFRALFVISKIARVFVSLNYASNVMQSYDMKMSKCTLVEMIILLYSYIVWNITFQYETEYFVEGTVTPSPPRDCSWLTIAKVWRQPSYMKWLFALNRAVSMMRFNLNMQYIEYAACCEIFMLCAWLIAKIIILHCAFKYIISFFGTQSAKAKYYVLTQQVEKFINQKKLPKNIKNNILKYYNLRFRSHFFVESRMINCVSGQLAEDILIYTGRLAVKKVGFLQQLPRSLLLQVGTQLKLVIFIAGDIIFKINTVGDCIYFINKGTVAVYSQSGIEIYHLEDGEYFGEAVLALRQTFRMTTAVAVTDCELFKLSREVFESIVTSSPTILQDLQKVALDRLQRHYVIEEKLISQLNDKNINFDDIDDNTSRLFDNS